MLAAFAIAFGTRRINPKEHQDGLILAIAVEALVKLAAFLAVGAFVVWGLNGGIVGLTEVARADPKIAAVIQTPPDPAVWGVTTLLSAFAIILLPRQFHVTVVENHDRRDLRAASWLFPAYLLLINLFVAPLAVAGLKMFPDGAINRDLTVLALPLAAGARGIALFTMIGGLSAATGMVVMECLALAITISNDLAMPLLLRRSVPPEQHGAEGDIGALVLWVRRLAILGVLALGFVYERLAGQAPLVSIGPLSFAALAQIAPAFLGGLFWRRGTARGAVAGMTAGSLAWIYLLLLPSIEPQRAIAAYFAHGPLAIDWLSPAALVGFAPNALVGGVVLSLAANIAAFVVFSLSREPSALERTQASAFAGARRASRRRSACGARRRPQANSRRRSRAISAPRGPAEPSRPSCARGGLEYDPAQEASPQLIRQAEFLLSPAHRRLHLSPGAVPPAPAARRLRPVGPQADRRGVGGDPVEPRPAAARARSRAPGHNRLRLQPGADRLESRIRRAVRPAALRCCVTASGSTRSCASTPRAVPMAPATSEDFVAERVARAPL